MHNTIQTHYIVSQISTTGCHHHLRKSISSTRDNETQRTAHKVVINTWWRTSEKRKEGGWGWSGIPEVNTYHPRSRHRRGCTTDPYCQLYSLTLNPPHLGRIASLHQSQPGIRQLLIPKCKYTRQSLRWQLSWTKQTHKLAARMLRFCRSSESATFAYFFWMHKSKQNAFECSQLNESLQNNRSRTLRRRRRPPPLFLVLGDEFHFGKHLSPNSPISLCVYSKLNDAKICIRFGIKRRIWKDRYSLRFIS